MNKTLLIIIVGIVSLLTATTAFLLVGRPLPTVDHVDLSKYIGEWNELYRFPTTFEDNTKKGYGTCFNATAVYSINADNTIRVNNTCLRRND